MDIRYDRRAVRRLMRERNIGFSEMARRAKTSRQHIVHIAQGPLGPSAAILARLAMALDVPVTAFFVEKDK